VLGEGGPNFSQQFSIEMAQHFWQSLILIFLAKTMAASSWDARTLKRYKSLRAGRASTQPATWYGTGTLHSTLSGDVIASVECFEKSQPLAADDGACTFKVERLFVYRAVNGSLLTAFKTRPVSPLRFEHQISMTEKAGGIELQAVSADGAQVASGFAAAETERSGFFGRAFRLRVRVAPPNGKSQRPQGTPGASPAAKGSTREEYHLVTHWCPWLQPQMVYRRIGRCPSWCGSSVCTLELQSERSPRPVFRPRSVSKWQKRIQQVEEEIESLGSQKALAPKR